MPTDTKLNQLIINQLTQEQYYEAKAAGTLSDTELYITDSDDDALTNNNISNCITEIPQDIKLELNNGTLTLKAGSKVYVPNGSTVFDEAVIPSDITVNPPYTNGPIFIYYHNNGIEQAINLSQCSGSSNTIDYGYWYDTTNNFIKRIDANNVSYSNVSFPLAIINASNGSWTSIDQVFNGFGYIGSTIYALPGVKGLIPNGRNADGSLKSIEFVIDEVISKTYPTNVGTGWLALNATDLGVVDFTYNEESNYVYTNNNIVPYINKAAYLIVDSSGKITSFIPKTVFHALDYNDKSTISGWSMPSNRYINLTLGASGSTYTAPANGWVWLVIDINANGFLSIDDNYFQGCGISSYVGGKIPVRAGQIIYIYYNQYNRTVVFRFIYAEGEN